MIAFVRDCTPSDDKFFTYFTWLIHGRFHPEKADESALVRDNDLFGDNRVELTSSVDLEIIDKPVIVPVMVPLPIDSFSLAISEEILLKPEAAIAEVKVAVEATE